MADLIRSFDWRSSEIGSISGWPDSLRSAVNLMLGCGFPTAIWWAGGGTQFYNDGYKPLMAGKHPSGLGQLAKECWREAWDIVSPQVKSVMDHGRPLFFENSLVPIERNGVLRDVYWTYSYSPIFGASGQTEGVLVTCQDVTDALMSGQRVEQSRAELKQVLDSISDGLLVLDKDWRYTYFNEQGATMLGLQREDLIGGIVWELFPHAEGTAFYRGYYQAVETGQPVHFEEFYPEPLNKWLECHCYPSAQGLSVYFRDITKQRAAEEALRKSEKLALAGRLSATIAHEINNPLSAIGDILYLLKENIQDSESRDLVAVAEQEINLVNQIVTQSLRLHRTTTFPSPEKVSLLLDSTVNMFKTRLIIENIQLKKSYLDRTLVTCFGSDLRQVFGNLVGNAMDALRPNGGTVHLRTREATDIRSGTAGVRVTIADTGVGMDGQTLKQIAEPFFTTKGDSGTGLGLWVTRDLLRKHHAEWSIKSKQGGGTVFSIFVPVAAVENETSELS